MKKSKTSTEKRSVKKIFTAVSLAVMSVVMCLSFTACKDKGFKYEVVDLTGVNGDNSTVKMSVLYTNEATRMKFVNSNIPYTPFAITSSYTGDKMKTYNKGDYKPAWEQLQKNLNFTIDDTTPTSATSVSSAFKTIQAGKFDNVNILSGPVSEIVDEAVANQTFVNLADYYEYLPNLKKFIDENEIVEKSITSGDGKVYYAPYCDGFDDVETMFICRVDWVTKLLDETTNDDDYDNGEQAKTIATEYESFYKTMNTSFEIADETAENHKKTVNVSYGLGGSIIDIQNGLTKKDGKSLTKALKDYIKLNYIDKQVFTKYSDLYCGQSACYNADELIALWRCICANPELLTGSAQTEMVAFYPRANTADRTNAIIQLAQLWGVRGYDSRSGYFYVDENGELADSRVSDDRMESLKFLNQLYKEGLIMNNYETGISGGNMDFREDVNLHNRGFMTYDYNQTTTIYNTIYQDTHPEMNLSPIMFPVADWDNKATQRTDGGYSVAGENTLYQYTESWRSVKTEGWSITAKTSLNKEVLKKCLEIFDYMYSEEGQRLMTYGPEAYVAHNADGTVKNIDYITVKSASNPTGIKQVPEIPQHTLDELRHNSVGQGNYTNYYRYFVGATLPIGYVKEQGMEHQTVDAKGAVGLNYIRNALNWGTLKHANVVKPDGTTESIQNVLVPSTFPLTKNETANIANNCSDLSRAFSNTEANGKNIFHDYIIFGFDKQGEPNQVATRNTKTAEGLKEQISKTLNGDVYVNIYNMTYTRMYAK